MKWRIQKRKGLYFVEKLMTKIKGSGFFWNREKIKYKTWKTVDLFGREWIIEGDRPVPPIASFKSKKKAKKFLKDLISEPKNVYEI